MTYYDSKQEITPLLPLISTNILILVSFYIIICSGIFCGGHKSERKFFMAKQKKLRENTNSNKTTDRKNINKAKPKKAGTVIAVILALVLIASSAAAVTYLINRGKRAMSDYSGSSVEATMPEEATVHKVEERDMPVLKADDKKSEGYLDGAVYIWKNKGYEVFKGSVKDAKEYASSISSYKRAFGKSCRVYDVVVPTSTEITLPERLSKTFSNNQRENINAVITNLSMDVTPVDVYNILGEHRNEYIYFNTDKYWTPLGAYYSYSELASKLKIKPADLKSMEQTTLEQSFLGSHISSTVSKETQNGNPKLLDNPDKITFFALPETVSVRALPKGSEEETDMSYYNTYLEDGASPSDIYASKDCAYTVLSNSNIESGKIALVTDKFGYALAPLLTYNYREVHLIDIDNFERNIKTYITKNKITDIVYLNGIMSANTAAKTAKMDAMF